MWTGLKVYLVAKVELDFQMDESQIIIEYISIITSWFDT